MQPLRQSILDMEAIMSVADIYEKRATFSFEVFPAQDGCRHGKAVRQGRRSGQAVHPEARLYLLYLRRRRHQRRQEPGSSRQDPEGRQVHPCYPLHLHRQHQGRHQGKAADLPGSRHRPYARPPRRPALRLDRHRTATCTTPPSWSSSSARSSATSSPSRSLALPRATSSAAASRPTSPS